MNTFSSYLNKPLILLFTIILGVPLLLLGTILSMVNVWIVNETFTHGFLIFPLTLWLIWQKKAKLSEFSPQPQPKVLVLLIMLLSGWFVSSLVGVQVVQQFSMIAIIIATVWAVTGRKIVSAVLFPLLFLFFAVPFGQIFIPPLMEFTASFTVFLIKLTGIPVYRDGMFFTLPSGSWSVVQECSGVRYLIASFSLGSIYAYINYTSTRKRTIFILLSIIVPILGNGIRAFGIVMIGHFSGMKLAVGADHLLYGWVFFGVIIFLLFFAGSFWWDQADDIEETSSANGSISGVTIERRPVTILVSSAFLILLSNFSLHAIEQQKLSTIQPVSLSIPNSFPGWKYANNRLLEWQPVIENADINLSRGYLSGKDFVQLNIAYYQVQRQGAEAISTMNSMASPLGGKWKRVASFEIPGNGMNFTEVELRSPDHKVLVIHWYRVGPFETSNPYLAKVLDAFNLIVNGRTDAAVISVATRLIGSKEEARQRLVKFWHDASHSVNNELERLAK